MATVHERAATVHAAAVTMPFRLAKAPGPGRAVAVFTATVRAGTVGLATGGGKAAILEGTDRMDTGVVAEPGGTVPGAGSTV